MSDDMRQQVSRTINAPADQIFDLLASPGRHTEIDGAGMLRGLAEGPDRVSSAGEAFVMNMNQDGIGDYQMRSEVVGFDEDRRISWAPAIYPVGSLSHLIGDTDVSGHYYAWDLEPDAAGGTRVTHTYDWSGVADESALPFYPRVTTDHMEGTLDRIAGAVGS